MRGRACARARARAGVLSRVREVAGSVCVEQLPRHNSPNIMALCGSKGSVINICQMIACVGQQAVGGARIQDGAQELLVPFVPLSW